MTENLKEHPGCAVEESIGVRTCKGSLKVDLEERAANIYECINKCCGKVMNKG